MSDRRKDMIEDAVKSAGLSIESWEPDPDYPDEGREDAVLGRFRVIEDDEERGFYSDTEGVIKAGVVGAAQFHNERVAMHFWEDGYDEPNNEIVDLTNFEAI